MHPAPALWTVGHSTHPWDEFVDLLRRAGIQTVADVRRYPGSRKWPQYSSQVMPAALQDVGIGYEPFLELGGRRKARADSVNTAWRSESFRGYADYMQTEPFVRGIDRLGELARRTRTVILCAEAVPWRCHRSLIADAMIARGWTVWDIMGAAQVKPHQLTDFARVDGTRVTYPAGAVPAAHPAPGTRRRTVNTQPGLFDQPGGEKGFPMARKEQRPHDLPVGSGKRGAQSELKSRPKQRGGAGPESPTRSVTRREKRRGS